MSKNSQGPALHVPWGWVFTFMFAIFLIILASPWRDDTATAQRSSTTLIQGR